MKYLVVLCDGMADRPFSALGGLTPMQAASKPIMDMLAKKSIVGTVLNVPAGMVPESDTANLAVLSYDPKVYSKGRSPLEAAAMGISMASDETAFRCNLVTLSEGESDYSERTILDHGADNISSEDAKILMQAVEDALSTDSRHFYPGMSYRESMIVKDAPDRVSFTRPHDIRDKVIGEYLPCGEDGQYYADLMRRSFDVLDNHPLNAERREKGLLPANSIWFWSPGKAANLPNFCEKWGVSATMISAVDLLKGIGFLAGMEVLSVEGATGTVDTNYSGKANAAINAFERGQDFVYIHIEGPDECGHQGDCDGKVRAIESIDSLILAPVYDWLSVCGEPFRILVLPDHPTPLEIKTHSSEPVPFFIYSSEENVRGCDRFTEDSAIKMPTYIPQGQNLLSMMITVKRTKPKSENTQTQKDSVDLAEFAGYAKKEEKTDSEVSKVENGVSTALSSKPNKRKTANQIFAPILEIFEIFAFSLVSVLLILTLLVRHSPVNGDSMFPTLKNNDILIISSLIYTPKRGDIVILQVDEPTHGVDNYRPLVKRLIALEGDEVYINYNTWEVKVNGVTLDEDYINKVPSAMYPGSGKLEPDKNGECTFTVSENCVIVMGDNRNNSKDSRELGEIDKRYIVGKALFRIFPLNSIGKP